MLSRREGRGRPWPLVLLALLTAAVIAFAITQIGPPASSARTSRQVVSAQDGVVQSTVSGTGNVQAGTDVSVNFQTSGTISNVDVHLGQHVVEGQLMATLDPTAAQLTVSQAQEQLTAAQDQLTALENGTTSGSGSGSGATATGASTTARSTAQFVALTTTTPKRKTPTRTTPTRTTPAPTRTTPAPTRTTPSSSTTTPSRSSAKSSSSTSSRTTSTPTTTTTTPSPASLASAQASIDSAEANLRQAQVALAKTNLYAPATGTIVSLSSLTVGDTVSAGGSSSASSSSGGSGSGGSGSGAGASGATGSGAGASSTSSSSSSSGSGSSSGAFAEIVDASSMTMTVSLSESDVTKVHVGQPATVSIDALSGVELGAHVSSIATVGSTSSSVVSYPATLTLDQLDPRVKPGMSASASIIVGQAQGVTVPTQAVTGSGSLATVNVMKSGKAVSQQVVVGLRGDTRAQIVSGLSAGQQVVITIALPALGSSSSSTSATGRLGGGLGGGLGGLGGGGGGAFLRGGGGGAFRGGG